MKDILQVLENESDLVNINKNYAVDEGYIKSVENDKKSESS